MAPTDDDIIEGAARALGLQPAFHKVDAGGYWTVATRPGSITKRTTWNPLRSASDSQRIQATLTIATYTHKDGHVEAGAMASDGTQHLVSIQPQEGGREDTLRRAIAHVAFMVHQGAPRAA
jgi:hypothetical protein